MYTTALIWLLLTPLILSLIVFTTRWLGHAGTRLAEILHLISVTAVLVFSLFVVQGVLIQGSLFAVNDWFYVDSLAAVFILIIGVVGFLVGLYTPGYIRNDLQVGELKEPQVSLFYGLFELFLFTMLLVVTANNVFIMWVAVEATTLGSAFLVGIYGHRESLEAAWKYVIMCTVGVAFGLYGSVLLYSDAVNFINVPGSGALWTEIVKNAQALDPILLKMAFVFALIGFGTKAGIFPMHSWLPDAHSEAPSPVSAMLSGVLLNCALFVIIRFSIILGYSKVGSELPRLIFLIFGALSVVADAFFMFAQRDIKRLLAYSSVENVGLILLGIGIGGPIGILAGLLQAINHSIVKSLMFCTTGNILMKYHTRNLGKIKGMLRAIPFTSLLLMLGALALVGLPPLNTFISKFTIITAGIQNGHIWLMIFLLLALAVIFAALMKVLSSAVFGEMPEGMTRGEVKTWGLVPLAVLGFFIFLLGVYIPPQLDTLLNEATKIIMAGQSVFANPDGLINLTKILIH
jgi:hydrogenase-4 component F